MSSFLFLSRAFEAESDRLKALKEESDKLNQKRERQNKQPVKKVSDTDEGAKLIASASAHLRSMKEQHNLYKKEVGFSFEKGIIKSITGFFRSFQSNTAPNLARKALGQSIDDFKSDIKALKALKKGLVKERLDLDKKEAPKKKNIFGF